VKVENRAPHDADWNASEHSFASLLNRPADPQTTTSGFSSVMSTCLTTRTAPAAHVASPLTTLTANNSDFVSAVKSAAWPSLSGSTKSKPKPIRAVTPQPENIHQALEKTSRVILTKTAPYPFRPAILPTSGVLSDSPSLGNIGKESNKPGNKKQENATHFQSGGHERHGGCITARALSSTHLQVQTDSNDDGVKHL
jgi:hypothetical protein